MTIKQYQYFPGNSKVNFSEFQNIYRNNLVESDRFCTLYEINNTAVLMKRNDIQKPFRNLSKSDNTFTLIGEGKNIEKVIKEIKSQGIAIEELK